jgi:hypothetical protein
MKTDELIARLAADLRPTTRFDPRLRAAGWLFVAAAYVLITAGAAFTRVLSGSVPAAGYEYLLEQIAATALVVAATCAAFMSAVPGGGRRALALTAAAAMAWLTVVVTATIGDLRTGAMFNATLRSESSCIVPLLAAGGLLWVVLALTLPRGAVVSPRNPALAASLAAVAAANLQACLVHPHAFSGTVLVWHGGTMLAMALLLTACGIGWLRARPRIIEVA